VAGGKKGEKSHYRRGPPNGSQAHLYQGDTQQRGGKSGIEVYGTSEKNNSGEEPKCPAKIVTEAQSLRAQIAGDHSGSGKGGNRDSPQKNLLYKTEEGERPVRVGALIER